MFILTVWSSYSITSSWVPAYIVFRRLQVDCVDKHSYILIGTVSSKCVDKHNLHLTGYLGTVSCNLQNIFVTDRVASVVSVSHSV